MTTILSTADYAQIERLVRISNEKPLNPDVFVPWDTEFTEGQVYLPESIVSLAGLPIYDTLTPHQRQELARHEVVQAMYAYCWSEGLFCTFMNRYILNRDTQDIERKFLIRELIEEYRHQEMFAKTIEKLNGQPIKVSWFQKFVGGFTAKFLPDSILFVSCIAIEMMADQYGELLRKHNDTYPVLRRVSQLHNIEEARHILYTETVLKHHFKNIGFFKSTLFSIIVLLNMRFFQTIYVRSEIYERIGIKNPEAVRKEAFLHYQKKFAAECMGTVVDFVNSFNGFNAITRPLWRRLLSIHP
jgi:P-aminobenzoate N-oxygenase AurF